MGKRVGFDELQDGRIRCEFADGPGWVLQEIPKGEDRDADTTIFFLKPLSVGMHQALFGALGNPEKHGEMSVKALRQFVVGWANLYCGDELVPFDVEKLVDGTIKAAIGDGILAWLMRDSAPGMEEELGNALSAIGVGEPATTGGPGKDPGPVEIVGSSEKTQG